MCSRFFAVRKSLAAQNIIYTSFVHNKSVIRISNLETVNLPINSLPVILSTELFLVHRQPL